MQTETYLKQGLLLDKRINYHLKRLEDLRADVCNISAPAIGKEKVKTSPSGDAPFVKALMRVEDMQQQINHEIDILVNLKEQINTVIQQADREEFRMLLTFKYLEGMTSEQISRMFNVTRSTITRWHREAIDQIKLPENPIVTRIW